MPWKPKAPNIPELYEFMKKAWRWVVRSWPPAKYKNSVTHQRRKKFLKKYEDHADECFELIQKIEKKYSKASWELT